MKGLKETGVYTIPHWMRDKLKDFYGGYADDAATIMAIKEVFLSDGYIMDTHTAVAYSVYKRYAEDSGDSLKTIILSTASPFKFPSAVMGSIDEKYKKMDSYQLIEEMSELIGINIPKSLNNIKSRPVVHNDVCARDGMKNMVCNILGI
jgi:threonine synthase